MQECFPAIPTVTKTSTTTSARQFSAVLDPAQEAYAVSGPLLTTLDSVLVTVAKYPDFFVTEVTATGAIGLRCQLGGAQGPYQSVLGEERLFVADYGGNEVLPAMGTPQTQRTVLRAYDLPYRSPAQRGWVGPRGGPLRASRPR